MEEEKNTSDSKNSPNGLRYDPENFPIGCRIEYEYGKETYYYRGTLVGYEDLHFAGIKTLVLFLRVDEIISWRGKEKIKTKQENPFIHRIKLLYSRSRIRVINKN